MVTSSGTQLSSSGRIVITPITDVSKIVNGGTLNTGVYTGNVYMKGDVSIQGVSNLVEGRYELEIYGSLYISGDFNGTNFTDEVHIIGSNPIKILVHGNVYGYNAFLNLVPQVGVPATHFFVKGSFYLSGLIDVSANGTSEAGYISVGGTLTFPNGTICNAKNTSGTGGHIKVTNNMSCISGPIRAPSTFDVSGTTDGGYIECGGDFTIGDITPTSNNIINVRGGTGNGGYITIDGYANLTTTTLQTGGGNPPPKLSSFNGGVGINTIDDSSTTNTTFCQFGDNCIVDQYTTANNVYTKALRGIHFFCKSSTSTINMYPPSGGAVTLDTGKYYITRTNTTIDVLSGN